MSIVRQAKVEAALGMESVALPNMIAAIKTEPRLWPAWLDAVQLIPNAEKVCDYVYILYLFYISLS